MSTTLLMPTQTEIIYGPMQSRRFGVSLGINLLPASSKLCNYDCVYCQYGSSHGSHPTPFPTFIDIESAVEEEFTRARHCHPKVDWIMIAGNGEPTLHPLFSQLIDQIMGLRNRLLPGVPVGILSNSSTCDRPEIRKALLQLDGRFMKLDAGNADLFKAIHHSVVPSAWTDVLMGLHHLNGTVLQSMFFDGHLQNVSDDRVDDWIDAVHYVLPDAVQIYTIDRAPKEEGLLPVSKEVLERIALKLRFRTGIPGRVFL